jgi:hypothetical protein
MMIGAVGAALVLIWFLFSAFFLSDSFSSPGGLSSNHVSFESDCAKCHAMISGVQVQKCSACHERTNDRTGVYSYRAHYLYRSGEAARVDSLVAHHEGDEGTCATCHPEHRGRETAITAVSDEQCQTCHDYASFDRHPEFEFSRRKTPDDSTLIFTHVRHTKFVKEYLEKRTGSGYIERACLYCHNSRPDGKSFEPLDFDAHCGDCHLTTSVETARLEIKDPGNPATPGVETLEMIRRRGGPRSTWAFFANPGEFTESAGKIVKSPVYHRDPWIMENLKLLRRMLFADGLEDLLMARRVGQSKSTGEAYAEAISTLRTYAAELRSRPEPEIQKDLVTIDSLLRIARRRVSEAGAVLPEEMFTPGPEASDLSPEERQAIAEFGQKLTRPCRVCHLVDGAAILGVKSRQRTLTRAEFDHRAHILERRCLDCHTAIPVEQALVGGDTTGLAARDRSSVQNLPGIANCLECHGPSRASAACVTCHFMHPNKESRGSLQLAVGLNQERGTE